MKKIIRILNLDIHSLNNAEYKNFMERFFKLIPLKAVSGEGDRPSELRLLGEEENMTSDFVGISDEDKATFNADMLLLTDVVNQSRTNDNTALLLNLDKRRDPLVSFIINTTSIQAYKPSDVLVDYASTKATINAFTKALAQQIAPRGIRVNAVAPGPIWTALQPTDGQPQDKLDSFGEDTALGRMGQPAELAPAYVFLASAESSYVIGETLNVNGGIPSP